MPYYAPSCFRAAGEVRYSSPDDKLCHDPISRENKTVIVQLCLMLAVEQLRSDYLASVYIQMPCSRDKRTINGPTQTRTCNNPQFTSVRFVGI